MLDYLRWNIGRRILATDYALPLAGHARLIVSGRQNYATLVYTSRLWDFPEQMFVLHALRPTDLFADVGSNVGGYTVLASAVAGARSVAFEPVPATFAELQRNIRLNAIEHLAVPHRIALGSESGVIRMTDWRGGMNHVVGAEETTGTVEVQMTTLDELLGDEPCHVIKMDAEGFEMSILNGAARTMANPALRGVIMELNSSGGRYGILDQDVHAEMTRHGFAPYNYDPMTRQLSPLQTYNRDGINTLYIRDIETASRHVRESVAYEVAGRLI